MSICTSGRDRSTFSSACGGTNDAPGGGVNEVPALDAYLRKTRGRANRLRQRRFMLWNREPAEISECVA